MIDFNQCHVDSRASDNGWYVNIRGLRGLAVTNYAGRELLSFRLNVSTVCNTWFEVKGIPKAHNNIQRVRSGTVLIMPLFDRTVTTTLTVL